MWPAIASFLLGIVGWFAASFFAKPLLDFLTLRSEIHEEIIFTGNVGPMVAGTTAYDRAAESLRRLGAKLQAANVAASLPLRWFLAKSGYDLGKAGRGLIGLSNSLANADGSRALQVNSVQMGLRLPRDYTDDLLQQVMTQMQDPSRDRS